MDTTDFTNQYLDQIDDENFNEQRRMDEEDRGLDRPHEDEAEELKAKQEEETRSQIIKEAYARLYKLGCNKDEIKTKLDKISMFFGNLGSVSNMSNQEIGLLNGMLNTMEIMGYTFENGNFRI